MLYSVVLRLLPSTYSSCYAMVYLVTLLSILYSHSSATMMSTHSYSLVYLPHVTSGELVMGGSTSYMGQVQG